MEEEKGRPDRELTLLQGPDGRRRRYEISPTATENVDELRFRYGIWYLGGGGTVGENWLLDTVVLIFFICRTDLPGEYFVQVRLVGDESRTVVKKARLTAEARGILSDIEILGTVASFGVL